MDDKKIQLFIKGLSDSLKQVKIRGQFLDKLIRINIIAKSLVKNFGLEKSLYFAARYVEPSLLTKLLEFRSTKQLLDKTLYHAGLGGRKANVQALLNAGATYLDKALVGAAAGNRLELIKEMLKRGAKMVNWALVEAAGNGSLEAVNLLLSQKAVYIEKAMKKAIENGHLKIVKYLSNSFELPSLKSIFTWAVEKNQLEIALWAKSRIPEFKPEIEFLRLVARNGRVDLLKEVKPLISPRGGGIVLAEAVKSNDPETVEYVLKNYRFISFSLALESAINRPIDANSIKILDMLLNQKLTMQDYDAILREAAKVNDIKLVQYAIDHGAKNYAEALTAAAAEGHIEIVSSLLPFVEGSTLTSATGRAARNGHLKVVQLLARDVPLRWDWAFHFGCIKGQKNIIEESLKYTTYTSPSECIRQALLLGKDEIVDVFVSRDVLDSNSRLYIAIWKNDLEKVKTAIDEGAESFEQAVHLASSFGREEIFEFLIDKIQDWSGLIFPIIEDGRKNIIKILIDRKIVTKDNAIRMARQQENIELVDYISTYL